MTKPKGSFDLLPEPVEQLATVDVPVTYRVPILRQSFTSPVQLSVEAPAGITGTFTPNPTTSDAVLTVVAAASVATGTYPVQVVGQSEGLRSSTQVTLKVQNPRDIALLVTPTFFALSPGMNATGTISVVSKDTSEPVSLSVEGLPAGATSSITQATTQGSTTFTIGVGTVPAGTSTDFQLIATKGVARLAFPMRLVVLAGGGLSVTSDTNTVRTQPSGTETVLLRIRTNTFVSVRFVLDGLPPGMSASIVSSSAGLIITFRLVNVAPGTYEVRVPFDGPSQATVNVPLTVVVG